MLAQQHAQAANQLAPLRRGYQPPGAEGLIGPLDGGIDIGSTEGGGVHPATPPVMGVREAFSPF